MENSNQSECVTKQKKNLLLIFHSHKNMTYIDICTYVRI